MPLKPYYGPHAGITIYHGDCREVLPSLGFVDLILTDPPYGLGIAANPFRQKFEPKNWDDTCPTLATMELLRSSSRHQCIWGGNFFELPPAQCFFIWDKYQPEDFSSSMCEQAWVSLKMPAKIFRQSVQGYEKWHPTQKPESLMRWCLKFFPDVVAVLDPFMGSGTTLRAAKDLGRYAIGIEIEEKYCEIAAKRLSQEVLEFVP
jgi:site-specific DNA-methyltransferase (adenine-specific)